jgi:hypothetical protein
VLITRARVEEDEDRVFLRVTAMAETSGGGRLVAALRPYNPEGIQFIETISFEDAPPRWLVNSEHRIDMGERPERVCFSDYHRGDVTHALHDEQDRRSVECTVGMAGSAALFPIGENSAKAVDLQVPLLEKTKTTGTAVGGKRESWPVVLAKTAQLRISDERLVFLYETAKRTLILLSAADVVPGPYTYKRFWFRDACIMSDALLAMNCPDRCRRALDSFPKRQKRSGYFQSQEGEWDSNGQVLWIMDRYCARTGEPVPYDWVQPMLDGVEWIRKKRVSLKKQVLHAGLLPAGFSGEHFGPNDFYYWDNFWSIAGLKTGGRRAGRAESVAREVVIDRYADEYKQHVFAGIDAIANERRHGAIPASPYRRMDAGAVGSLAADYPLQLTAPGDRRIMNTASFLVEHCFHDGAFFQDMIHSGINAYLTLAIAQTFLRAGDPRFRALLERVADLATDTGQWPEAIHPLTGGGCMGDGQHGWAAAEWVLMLRNMFVREERDSLVVGSGLFPEWLKQGEPIAFGPTPTPFGTVTVSFASKNNELTVEIDAAWRQAPGRVVVAVPGYERLEAEDIRQSYTVSSLQE